MANGFNMTLEDVIVMFDDAYQNNNIEQGRSSGVASNFLYDGHPLTYRRLPRKRFYCGITNDISARESQHNAKLLTWVKSQNVDAAIELERALGLYGFEIGSRAGNGATNDSVYVYIYKIIPGVTKEQADL